MTYCNFTRYMSKSRMYLMADPSKYAALGSDLFNILTAANGHGPFRSSTLYRVGIFPGICFNSVVELRYFYQLHAMVQILCEIEDNEVDDRCADLMALLAVTGYDGLGALNYAVSNIIRSQASYTPGALEGSDLATIGKDVINIVVATDPWRAAYPYSGALTYEPSRIFFEEE